MLPFFPGKNGCIFKIHLWSVFDNLYIRKFYILKKVFILHKSFIFLGFEFINHSIIVLFIYIKIQAKTWYFILQWDFYFKRTSSFFWYELTCDFFFFVIIIFQKYFIFFSNLVLNLPKIKWKILLFSFSLMYF